MKKLLLVGLLLAVVLGGAFAQDFTSYGGGIQNGDILVNVGAAYYFTETIGAFVEAGYEYAYLNYTKKLSTATTPYTDYGNKYITAGLALKF